MADYYSLLARAVANLPKTSPPSTRRAIYERARKALTNQLRSLKPQLPESDIAREERALDEAVARLEAEFEPATADVRTLPLGAAPAEAELAEPPPAPAPPPPPPPPPRAAEPTPPVLRAPRPAAPAAPPRAPTPPLRPPSPTPKPPPAPSPQGLPSAAAFRGPLLGSATPEPAASSEPTLGSARYEDASQADAPPLEAPVSRQDREPARPTLADVNRRKTPTWLWIAGAVAVGFAGSIAVAALLMRPALQDLSPPPGAETPVASPEAAPEKSAQRVGQTQPAEPSAPASPTAEPSPTASAAPSPGPEIAASPTATPEAAPSPTTASTPNAAPTVPIASRAAMLVATVADAAKPSITVGTAVWSIVPAPAGQPQGIGVKAEIDIPDLKLRASIILRKNFDASLPASHTIDLRVTFDPGSPIKGVKDIALPLMRRDDPPAADALAGVRVKISENYFLIGLNRADADLVRNVQEIAERGWFDFPMQLDDDRIAKLTFEKGSDGEKAVAQVLTAWK